MAGFSVPLARVFYQGQVAAGAKINTWVTGTTTPVTVYTDAALTQPASNPITCDSNGEAVFFVTDSTVLRLYITTSGGTLIRDIDPVYPVPNLANSSLALNAHGQCRLTKSGSNILLSPYNGNRLVINGQGQTIPAAGVSLAPSALSTSTLYYIYAYMSGSTMVLEASTTANATSSTDGVEIKTGDATRSFVGTATTDAGTAWRTDRVTSWFNPYRLIVMQFPPSATISGSGTFYQNGALTSADSSLLNTPISAGGTLVGFYVYTNGGPSAGSAVVAVTKNGSATASTVSFSGGAELKTDLANTVAFATGDRVGIRIDLTSATGSWYHATLVLRAD